MKRTGWQQSWVRFLTTMLTAAVMIMIFVFSMQNAEKSDRTSGLISETVIRIIYEDYEQMDTASRRSIYAEVQHTVRKCAHFTEYLLLGIMLRLCLESWLGKSLKKRSLMFPGALTAGVLYACTDELHQLMIDGRSGQWTDVLVDGGGVLIGVLIGMLIVQKVAGSTAEEGAADGIFQN